MSNLTYKVKTNNETTQTVAIKFYGTPAKESLIIQANPATEAITSASLFLPVGMILNIPQEQRKKQPKKIPVTPQPEPEVLPEKKEIIENEEVSLIIDGTIFKFWENADITLPLDSFRSFSLSCPFEADNDQWIKLFQPYKYQSCVLYAGGLKILTGNIIKISAESKADSDTLNIEGYSKCAILSDVCISASSYPLTFNGLNLKQIVEKIIQPFGIGVIFDEDAGNVFKGKDKIEIEPDKNIFDFLTDLAKQRNLIIGDDADGNIVFKKATTEKAKYSLINRKFPVINSNFSFDGQRRFSDITCVSEKNGVKQNIKDNEMNRNGVFRPTTRKIEDIEKGGIKKACQSEWGRTLSDSFTGSINLLGWKTPNNELIKPNERFMYLSPGNMIYKETELLIREVKLSKSPNSITSSISVVMPESYLDSQPERMPWEK